MYCPKCGAENQEDIAYCRSCGEDLKIILQAMKKHLPLALVSKLDAVIEKKNERLRRDGILWAFWGVVFTILIVSGGVFFTTPVFPVLGTLLTLLFLSYFFISGGMYFLAYRRSFELKTKVDTLPDTGQSLSSDISPVDKSYCPKCGAQNSVNLLYCPTCGFALNIGTSPRGLEKYLPAFLIKRLDLGIARNEEGHPKFKTFGGIVRGTSFWLILAILTGVAQDWWNMVFWLFVFLSRFLIHGWDLLADQRSLKRGSQPSEISSDLTVNELPIHQTNDPWEFLRQMKDLPTPDEILEEEAPATLPLEPPLSNLEATTKPLDKVVEEIKEG